jgi:hypothetical protein
MTTWRMRIACWIPKATNTRSEYATPIAFPLQQWLHERISTLRYSTLPVFLCTVIMFTRPCKSFSQELLRSNFNNNIDTCTHLPLKYQRASF